jgi:putative endonuclease
MSGSALNPDLNSGDAPLPSPPDQTFHRDNTRAIGTSSEDAAVEYLTAQGYTIIERNYRMRNGEIDCIARDKNGTLVFVEVKSARTATFGHPFYWVGPSKQRTLCIVAKHYLATHPGNKGGCRFDVIALFEGKIEHLKNAFLAR